MGSVPRINYLLATVPQVQPIYAEILRCGKQLVISQLYSDKPLIFCKTH